MSPALLRAGGVAAALTTAGDRTSFRDHGTLECGDLDAEAFRALVSETDPVQRWLQTLPLADVIADSLMDHVPSAGLDQRRQSSSARSAWGSDSILRLVSEVPPDQLTKVVTDAVSAIAQVLVDGAKALQQSLAVLDQRTKAAMDSKTGLSKFASIVPSHGTVDDFHRGLAGRVGDCRQRHVRIGEIYERAIASQEIQALTSRRP
jgi:hypothetical protein